MLGKEDLQAIEQLMRTVVEENNKVLREEVKEDITGLRTELKGDITGLRKELKGDITGLRTELKGDITSLRKELKGDITGLRTELKEDIADAKTELRDEFRTEMAELKKDIVNIIDEKIDKSETFLLDEMDRYYQMTKKDILRLESKVNRIDQYYSVRKLEDETRDLRLQLHDKEIEDIKEKLAM